MPRRWDTWRCVCRQITRSVWKSFSRCRQILRSRPHPPRPSIAEYCRRWIPLQRRFSTLSTFRFEPHRTTFLRNWVLGRMSRWGNCSLSLFLLNSAFARYLKRYANVVEYLERQFLLDILVHSRPSCPFDVCLTNTRLLDTWQTSNAWQFDKKKVLVLLQTHLSSLQAWSTTVFRLSHSDTPCTCARCKWTGRRTAYLAAFRCDVAILSGILFRWRNLFVVQAILGFSMTASNSGGGWFTLLPSLFIKKNQQSSQILFVVENLINNLQPRSRTSLQHSPRE